MATFITLRSAGISGRLLRINIDHLTMFRPTAEGERAETALFLLDFPDPVLVCNTVAEVEAMIAQATAPTFRCRSCGRTVPEADHAPDGDYGLDICGDCWTVRDRAALASAVERLR